MGESGRIRLCKSHTPTARIRARAREHKVTYPFLLRPRLFFGDFPLLVFRTLFWRLLRKESHYANITPEDVYKRQNAVPGLVSRPVRRKNETG